jgi:hypothetical protein
MTQEKYIEIAFAAVVTLTSLLEFMLLGMVIDISPII